MGAPGRRASSSKLRRARGYRVAKQPDRLHAALIEAQIKVRVRGFSLAVWDEIDSTNDEAARQLAAGCPAPFAVFARRQTRGEARAIGTRLAQRG